MSQLLSLARSIVTALLCILGANSLTTETIIQECGFYNGTITIGVLDYRPSAYDEFFPTFGDYLNQALHPYDCGTRVEMVSFEDMDTWVDEERGQFVFLNPSMFAEIYLKYSAQVVLVFSLSSAST